MDKDRIEEGRADRIEERRAGCHKGKIAAPKGEKYEIH